MTKPTAYQLAWLARLRREGMRASWLRAQQKRIAKTSIAAIEAARKDAA